MRVSMIVDIIILAWFFVAGFEGSRKGAFQSGLELTAFSGGLLLGFRYYGILTPISSGLIGLPKGISNLLGFILIFLLSSLIFFIITEPVTHRLRPGIEKLMNLTWYRALGSLLDFTKTLILTVLILAIIINFPLNIHAKQLVQRSHLGYFLASQADPFEIAVKHIFRNSVEDGIFFSTVITERRRDPARPGKPPAKYLNRMPAQERKMLDLINRERRGRGVPLLAYDNKLSNVATKHSLDMYKRNFFDHLTPEGHDLAYRLGRDNIDYLYAGENLALAGNLEAAHNGLMASDGHRSNILDPSFKRVGIGIIDAGPFQQITTQVFTD